MTLLNSLPPRHVEMLSLIKDADDQLTAKFADKMSVNHDLDRRLVSFQANREEVGHRWCKYREGFSASLIRYIIVRLGLERGTIIDPFAGSGTTAFIAAELGLDAVGIELLPSSAEIVDVRNALRNADQVAVIKFIRGVLNSKPWLKAGSEKRFSHIRITAGAFPEENERQLGRFLWEASQTTDKFLARLLSFAALCILEEISFTRKDGQYLRWDQRSGRCLGKSAFDKGAIRNFDEAITDKLKQIIRDIEGVEQELELFPSPVAEKRKRGNIVVKVGSCLDLMPRFSANIFSALITSPPYCNRYDYTRTYALELAMMNVGEDGIRDLRQQMLSCTVENKTKNDLRQKFGDELFDAACLAFESQHVLMLILEYLDQCKVDGTINNPGIVRMVRNYFFEMALLIFASARALEPGAPFVMVNDNVRYQGAHVPVDLILSDIAMQAGYNIEAIWVLPKGKGNSSQQMGIHGRQEVRKCVYIWRKDR